MLPNTHSPVNIDHQTHPRLNDSVVEPDTSTPSNADRLALEPETVLPRLRRLREEGIVSPAEVTAESGVGRQEVWAFTHGQPQALSESEQHALAQVLAKYESLLVASQTAETTAPSMTDDIAASSAAIPKGKSQKPARTQAPGQKRNRRASSEKSQPPACVSVQDDIRQDLHSLVDAFVQQIIALANASAEATLAKLRLGTGKTGMTASLYHRSTSAKGGTHAITKAA